MPKRFWIANILSWLINEIEDLINGVLSPKNNLGIILCQFFTRMFELISTCLEVSSSLFLKADHDDTYMADKDNT